MNKNFVKICRMSQAGLKDYVKRRLPNTHKNIISGDGFVYAEGTFPVLLVAHLDTVHDKLPETVLYDANKGAFYCDNGIGGDDRCGVYMIFEVLKRFNCSVLFCEDEEIGMIGAKKFIETDLAKSLSFNYMIEFDRRGSNDAVFYDCDNPEFTEFITKEFYKEAYGSFSDISTLAPEIGCAAVNLSCGYHNAHTKKEYVVLEEMEASIEAACKILERTTEEDKFEYIEGVGGYSGWYSGGYYGESPWYHNAKWWSDIMYGGNNKEEEKDEVDDSDYDPEYYDRTFSGNTIYLIEYTSETEQYDCDRIYADSQYEAVGKWVYNHPTLTFYDIRDISHEK